MTTNKPRQKHIKTVIKSSDNEQGMAVYRKIRDYKIELENAPGYSSDNEFPCDLEIYNLLRKKKIIRDDDDEEVTDEEVEVEVEVDEDDEESEESENDESPCIILKDGKKISYPRDNAKVPPCHMREYIMKMGYRKFTWHDGWCEFDEDYIKIRKIALAKNGGKNGYTEKFMPASKQAWKQVITKLCDKTQRTFSFFRTDKWDSDASGYDSDCSDICYSLDPIYYIPQSNYFLCGSKYSVYERMFKDGVSKGDNKKIIRVLDILAGIGLPQMPRYVEVIGRPYYNDIITYFDTTLFKKITDIDLRNRAVATWYAGCRAKI